MDTPTAEKIIKAYREGLSRRAESSPIRPAFETLLLQLLWTRLPARQRLAFRKIWKLSQQGLKATREGHLAYASSLFEQGWKELAGVEDSRECSLLATSFLAAAHAYLDYREGRFEEARSRVFVVMEADLALELTGEYGLFEIHRIQAANNLMRVDLRLQFTERALALAGCILAYLEEHNSGLPVHHSWYTEKLRGVPRALRRAMLAQIANEAAAGLVRSPGTPNWQVFYANLEPQLYATPSSSLHPRILQWLRLRESFIQEDWESYIHRLVNFLPAGREDISPIWYSSVIDCLDYCHQLGSRLAGSLRDHILRDSAQWPCLPKGFRQRLK